MTTNKEDTMSTEDQPSNDSQRTSRREAWRDGYDIAVNMVDIAGEFAQGGVKTIGGNAVRKTAKAIARVRDDAEQKAAERGLFDADDAQVAGVYVVSSVDEHATVDVDGVYGTRSQAENRARFLTGVSGREHTVWERPVVGASACPACGTDPPDGTSCACFSVAAAGQEHPSS